MAKVQKTNAFDSTSLERLASTYEAEHRELRHISHIRTPVILSTTNWLYQGKFISLWINPLNTSWSLPRRETSTKTAAGVIRNTWWNRYRNTYYDEFTVNFTFQTGSVLPSVSVSDKMVADPDQSYRAIKSPPPPPGLVDFYRFLDLVNQPMLMGQAENRHIILYRSRVFPRLRMEGYFVGETPIAFTENAEGNANMLQWTATFQCYKSVPQIWEASRLISDWTAWASKSALVEIMPTSNLNDALLRTSEEEAKNSKAKAAPTPTKGTSKPVATASTENKKTLSSAGRPEQREIGIVTGGVKGTGATALTPKQIGSPSGLGFTFDADGKLKPTSDNPFDK